jgi:hypothetical protein
MIERFPTAEERWPRQGLTMPYNFPKLVIEEHEGFHIVRDDLLEGGSKRRFVDRMIREEIAEGAEEFVYGGLSSSLTSCINLYFVRYSFALPISCCFILCPTETTLTPLPETSIRIWCRYTLGAKWYATGYKGKSKRIFL